jgi:hypothetical protein
VLENLETEREKLSPAKKNNFIQSFLIDSQSIDPVFLDSLIPYI